MAAPSIVAAVIDELSTMSAVDTLRATLASTACSTTRFMCTQCEKFVPSTKVSRCSRCTIATYCGAVCQKAHWAEHRPTCNGVRFRRDAAPGVMEDVLIPCKACEKEVCIGTMHTCSRCYAVGYCSDACRRAYKRTHRPSCAFFISRRVAAMHMHLALTAERTKRFEAATAAAAAVDDDASLVMVESPAREVKTAED